ncbi:hypothetical protein BT69DRAFT_1276198, partial [Atractiella rhizophila]
MRPRRSEFLKEKSIGQPEKASYERPISNKERRRREEEKHTASSRRDRDRSWSRDREREREKRLDDSNVRRRDD